VAIGRKRKKTYLEQDIKGKGGEAKEEVPVKRPEMTRGKTHGERYNYGKPGGNFGGIGGGRAKWAYIHSNGVGKVEPVGSNPNYTTRSSEKHIEKKT